MVEILSNQVGVHIRKKDTTRKEVIQEIEKENLWATLLTEKRI